MSKTVAYCGLLCQTCPLYLATRQENKEERARMRAEIVKLCQEHYGMNYALADITDCDGCKAETGRLFSASENCAVRNCAKQKNLENCAYCTDYACGKLEAIFKTDPAARARLDKIRSCIR
jgi:histidinol-phosphate/aromatic aminotransferase/cobyric acid decarboxylase-like protein